MSLAHTRLCRLLCIDGDTTCMMGAHNYNDDEPEMCFGGPKSYNLGWYNDRTDYLEASDLPWSGKLAGIDDYRNGNTVQGEHYIVIQVGNLYVMWNRRKGINRGVVGFGDEVTVTQQVSTQSWLNATLSAGQDFKTFNWGGSGELVIKFCHPTMGTPDYANVNIYLSRGTQPSCPPFPATPLLTTLSDNNGSGGKFVKICLSTMHGL